MQIVFSDTPGVLKPNYKMQEMMLAFSLINIFFPEVIGLSGGVANQGENLLKPLRAAATPMVFGSAFAKKHTRITTCTLGYRAGVIGAALLAKQEV